MKRIKCLPVGMTFLLVMLGLCCSNPVLGQVRKDRGQEAQSSVTAESGQMEGRRMEARGGRMETESRPMTSKTIDPTADAHSSLRQSSPTPSPDLQSHPKWVQKFRPQKPQKPIPLVLILLGALFVAVWFMTLLGAILATSAVLTLVFLILTLVFIPVLIIGIVFLIGGIVAATSGGRPPQAMRR
jgi:hypothetical protein